MQIVYEDNHIIIVNKSPGEIVQGDKTGDEPLVETLKRWIKEKYAKPGNVFCGVVHRLDRPVGGLVVFAKTSKALTRLNEMFRKGEVDKTYWALSRNRPEEAEGRLVHYITTTERNNKSYASVTEKKGSKKAVLSYKLLGASDRYSLIGASAVGWSIKGDLKYGDKRSNPDGSISLMAKRIKFVHPVSGKMIDVTAPLPDEPLWQAFKDIPAV